MKFIVGFCFAFLATSSWLFAQDQLASHKILGLEGLREIAFVTLPSPDDRTTIQTLTDALTIAMARKLPEVKKTGRADAEWLELSWIVLPGEGATMTLSVLRWVRLEGGSKLFMATVWREHWGLFVGNVTTKTLTDAVEPLVTRLAADYLTANPPRR